MSASTSEPWIEFGIGHVRDSNSFIGRCRCRGAKRTRSKWLGPPQDLARRPLRERRAENLRSRTLGQQLDLEAIEHFVFCLAHAEIRGTQVRQPCVAPPDPCRAFDLSVHSLQQGRPRGFQSIVRNTGERRIVTRRPDLRQCTSERRERDAPLLWRRPHSADVSSPFSGLTCAEISAVSPQFTKERFVVVSRRPVR